MKSLKTKVIMSAFVLLFALVATIGSTYAWFTISDTVTVQSVDLTVTSEDSLLIRVWDGESETPGANVSTYDFGGGAATGSADDFSNVITSADIASSTQYELPSAYYLTPVTAAYNPVTTSVSGDGAGTDFQSLDMDELSTISVVSPSDRTLSPASANQTTAGTSGYIEIKFWLMSQASANTVKLSSLTATGSTAGNAIYLGTKAETDTTENIFAVNSDWGFAFTSSDAGFIVQDTDHINNDETTYWNSIPSGTQTVLTGLESTVNSDSDIVVSLGADIPEIVTVRIWIEGWDAQAVNSIMGDTITLTFAFTII